MTSYVYLDRWIGADRDEMLELAVGLNLDSDVVSVEARDAVEARWVYMPPEVAAQIDLDELAEEARERADLAARGWP